MSNYNFSIKGQDLLLRKLKQNMQKEAVKKIVKERTANMQVEAQKLAPVDTGNLKRSIRLELLKGGMAGAVISPADYSGYQEFGTRFMAAQPYMGPAFRKHRNLFVNDLKNLTK
ncbi:HK97-gp10 family putative phage morphogenesis protein [Pediococcus acidilactici]|uniref:HK97-gp10 family putative phage morphogenesis protein n=1 Tax=Pediococcus acidilactici TaxID=1254 RepID=UPI002935DD42|nr:HK97-gp10 family putative phage morphogenesis protein [Pediococcus acidilactici]MDV2602164.1 HK97 gp10 family phage protein [Pediococcus acidilactici]MDV2843589.1 HK97 gp10 family phage protein [Pediococcus acidilactici]WQS22781.1 HK97 gp10 family phage protein [Pediococcus acidilactici]WQS26302.1 HK97 gp10 family phage protein [Pediococcus acidilactici]